MNPVSKARFKLIALILLVIALIHFALLYPMLKSPKSADPVTDSESTEQTDIPKEPALPKTVKSASRYRVPSTNPEFGKPFHYATAVNGDLANLPASVGATTGFMVDLETRNVLWMKNRDRSVPIASMVKMMTILTAFETLEEHPEWSLEMPVPVSVGTTKVGNSGVIWLDTRESPPLEDLLKAATIKSANDAAHLIGETMGGGDLAAFIARMNKRAGELKMPGTMFVSPHGLPSKSLGNSLSTAEGMVILGERLLEYPKFMEWSTTKQTRIKRVLTQDGKVVKEFETELTTTNHLVNPRWPGVDGMKTGYTNDAGFCLTFTALRNGKRIMGCVTGFPTAVERDRFCRKLIDWGYSRAADIAAGKTAPPTAAALTQTTAAKNKAAAKPAAKKQSTTKKR